MFPLDGQGCSAVLPLFKVRRFDISSARMNYDRVAVVIPCYQQEHYLFRLVCSVIWQLREGDELIVVHDSPGPLDPKFLAPFADRVTVIQTAGRQGVSFCRNRGIEKASAHWIKFIDADDLVMPYALDVVRSHWKIPETTQVITGGMHKFRNGNYECYLLADQQTFDEINLRTPTMPSLTFVRRAALLDVGMFNEEIDFEEDWDLWFRIRERYGIDAFQIVDQPVCAFWVSDADRKTKQRTAKIKGRPVRDYFRERYGAEPV